MSLLEFEYKSTFSDFSSSNKTISTGNCIYKLKLVKWLQWHTDFTISPTSSELKRIRESIEVNMPDAIIETKKREKDYRLR